MSAKICCWWYDDGQILACCYWPPTSLLIEYCWDTIIRNKCSKIGFWSPVKCPVFFSRCPAKYPVFWGECAGITAASLRTGETKIGVHLLEKVIVFGEWLLWYATYTLVGKWLNHLHQVASFFSLEWKWSFINELYVSTLGSEMKPMVRCIFAWWGAGYLSGVKCRFAYGPAHATTTHWLLLPGSRD